MQSLSTPHLDDNQIAQYLEGSADDTASIESHLGQCPECMAIVNEARQVQWATKAGLVNSSTEESRTSRQLLLQKLMRDSSTSKKNMAESFPAEDLRPTPAERSDDGMSMGLMGVLGVFGLSHLATGPTPSLAANSGKSVEDQEDLPEASKNPDQTSSASESSTGGTTSNLRQEGSLSELDKQVLDNESLLTPPSEPSSLHPSESSESSSEEEDSTSLPPDDLPTSMASESDTDPLDPDEHLDSQSTIELPDDDLFDFDE